MKIPILTDTIQSWQIDQWIEQGYQPISLVKGYEGFIITTSPGVISIDKGLESVQDVESIPTTEARLEGIYIVMGEEVCEHK